ncbi:MAG: hypothetical protein PWQ73_745 [Petrotoga sp.]|nr:hypothetical protein [Petrotoga sp.]
MEKNNKKIDKSVKPRMELNSVSVLSPHNEALYETGKEMLKGSLNTTRDFCKFMITVSMGAIPTYLALLEFVLDENITLPINELMSIVPPFFFLISAIIFIFGYFPQVDYFSLDIVEEIKQAYEKTVAKRKKLTNWGIFLFLVGSVFAILSITINIIG